MRKMQADVSNVRKDNAINGGAALEAVLAGVSADVLCFEKLADRLARVVGYVSGAAR